MKTSLYRFDVESATTLSSLVQGKYLERPEFAERDVYVGNRAGLLVSGYIPNPRPKWLDHARSLTGVTPEVENRTAVGLLLLRLDDEANYVYGLGWGMAHLIVRSGLQEEGFGLRFALRRADASQLSGLTTHALDSVPKTARTSVLGGANLEAFGMEEVGEILGRLIGKVPAEGLSSEKVGEGNVVTVRGADSLSLPLAKSAESLLRDLAFIDRVIRDERPAAGLEHLENTYPLKPGHPRIEALSARLSVALDGSAERLALCWPAEWDEEFGEASSYRISGAGRSSNGDVEELELDDILALVADRAENARLDRLKNIRLQGLAAGGTALSRAIAADRWLTYEVDDEGERFVFHRGRWYNIGGSYLEMLRSRVGRILAVTSDIELPAWPKVQKTRRKTGEPYLGPVTEGYYNEYLLTADRDDLQLMDKKLITSQFHPNGFEACDAVTHDGALIHVKRLDDSVAASHLFNQAIVSAEALSAQNDARDNFVDQVSELSDGRIELGEEYRPVKVVLAFAGGGTSTAERLFTFSQVALSRCALRLATMRIELSIARLDESDTVVSSPEV